MIYAMTVTIALLFLLFLLLGLAALRHWAAHDRFAAKRRPAWFD